MSPSKRTLHTILLTTITFCLFLLGLVMAMTSNALATANNEVNSSGYLPIVIHIPTPTPTPIPQPVELAGAINLPQAMCPNDLEVNEASGYLYVANSYSDNVSIIQDDVVVKNIPTGKLPTQLAAKPNTNLVYLTNLTDVAGAKQIALLDGLEVKTNLPDKLEPYAVVVNRFNGYAYVTDLDSNLRIFNDDQLIADIDLDGAGWPLGIAADGTTGRVYVASYEHGFIYVIEDTAVVDKFDAGWGAVNIAVDETSGFVYVVHRDPSDERPQNISVFHRDDHTVTPFYTAKGANSVAVDPQTSLAYVTNSRHYTRDNEVLGDDTVTILRGREQVKTVSVADGPWAVSVNPNTGDAVMAHLGEHRISVWRNGEQIHEYQLADRTRPWAVTWHLETNTAYVVNRAHRFRCDSLDRCENVCDPAAVNILR